jgi:hypothetical protein
VKGSRNVGPEVEKFRGGFQAMHFCFNGKAMEEQRSRLLATV